MDRILVIIFLISVIPYLGIPNRIDTWIVLFLVGAFLYCLYLVVQENNIVFVVPTDDPDDFLQEHDVMGTGIHNHIKNEQQEEPDSRVLE